MKMEPTTGIEPVNLFLTKEALYRLSYVGRNCVFYFADWFPSDLQFVWAGAGDEARTRDIQLGRLKLYQLSYSRPIILHYTLYPFSVSPQHKT